MSKTEAEVIGAKLNFGCNLKKRILEKGFTVDGVARKLNINKSLFRKYLNGYCLPEFERIIAIALILDCTIDWLFWGKE